MGGCGAGFLAAQPVVCVMLLLVCSFLDAQDGRPGRGMASVSQHPASPCLAHAQGRGHGMSYDAHSRRA